MKQKTNFWLPSLAFLYSLPDPLAIGGVYFYFYFYFFDCFVLEIKPFQEFCCFPGIYYDAK